MPTNFLVEVEISLFGQSRRQSHKSRRRRKENPAGSLVVHIVLARYIGKDKSKYGCTLRLYPNP